MTSCFLEILKQTEQQDIELYGDSELTQFPRIAKFHRQYNELQISSSRGSEQELRDSWGHDNGVGG